MRYATFRISETAAINDFLKENSEHLAKDGVAFLDGAICILYDPSTPAELERRLTRESISTFISGRLAELLGADVDERYWRGRSLRADDKAEKRVLEAAQRGENLAAQVRIARDILAEVETGAWRGNPARTQAIDPHPSDGPVIE